MVTANRTYINAGLDWTAGELEILSDKFGLVPDEILAEELGRSPLAMEVAAKRHAHTARGKNLYTRADVVRELGATDNQVMSWLKKGWIKCARSARRTRKQYWKFSFDEIESALQARPWLADRLKMPEGYFRAVVRRAYAADPWYTSQEASRILGLNRHTIFKYISRGRLKASRFIEKGSRSGSYVIRRSELERYKKAQ